MIGISIAIVSIILVIVIVIVCIYVIVAIWVRKLTSGTQWQRPMLSKRSLGFDEVKVSPNKRFRLNLTEVFLSNTISAGRAASILRDAAAAGAEGVADLAHMADDKNVHRNLLRKLLKSSKWPRLYWAKVHVWNKRTMEVEEAMVPMLLVHELVATFHAHRQDDQQLFDTGSLDEMGRRHIASVAGEINAGGPVVGLGLWLDGVAAKWDRAGSIDMLTLSLPGQTGRWKAARIPLCSIDHSWVAKHQTWDDILAVVTWSLQMAAMGVYPTQRPDGQPWLSTDVQRRRRAGQPLGCKAALVQVTGDWKMYKDIFRFPQHNERDGCCFRCAVRPAGIRDTGSAAPWRQDRLDHWGIIARMRQKNLTVSPLFQAPGVRAEILRIDWLHVADLGVAADWLGQLFVYLLGKFGGSAVAGCASLWRRIQELYVRYPPFAKLDTLTVQMLRVSGPPKLRCYGSECRGLIPIARHLAEEMLATNNELELTIQQATFQLHSCYATVSTDGAALAEHSRKFCTLWVSLEQVMPGSFHVKPKMHLFQEMCELQAPGARPLLHSTYREEEFGGSVAALGRRRGGAAGAGALGNQTLLKFCALHKVPEI